MKENLRENSGRFPEDSDYDPAIRAETTRVNSNIDKLLESREHEKKIIKNLDFLEQIKLRNSLNLMISENVAKTSHLATLKEAVKKLQRVAINDVTSSQLPLHNKVQNLMSQVIEAENRLAFESKNSEALSNMRAKERLAANILNQRMREMDNQHYRITKHHVSLNQNMFTSKNNAIVVQNETNKYEDKVAIAHKDFQMNYHRLENLKNSLKLESEDIIERMCVHSIQKKDNESAKRSLMQELEINEELLKNSHQELEKTKKAISIYYLGFKEIEDVINRMHDLDLSFEHGLNTQQIQQIIDSYKDLQFQEISLGNKYQELSFFQAKKRDDL